MHPMFWDMRLIWTTQTEDLEEKGPTATSRNLWLQFWSDSSFKSLCKLLMTRQFREKSGNLSIFQLKKLLMFSAGQLPGWSASWRRFVMASFVLAATLIHRPYIGHIKSSIDTKSKYIYVHLKNKSKNVYRCLYKSRSTRSFWWNTKYPFLITLQHHFAGPTSPFWFLAKSWIPSASYGYDILSALKLVISNFQQPPVTSSAMANTSHK